MNPKLRVFLISMVELLLLATFYVVHTVHSEIATLTRAWVIFIMILYCVSLFLDLVVMTASYILLRKYVSGTITQDEYIMTLITLIKGIMSKSPPTWWYIGSGVTKGMLTVLIFVLTGYVWAAVLWIIFAELYAWEIYFRAHTVLHEIDSKKAPAAYIQPPDAHL